MKYREIADGIFLDRPNRFIAHVNVNGVVETVHAPHNNHLRERLMVLVQELPLPETLEMATIIFMVNIW